MADDIDNIDPLHTGNAGRRLYEDIQRMWHGAERQDVTTSQRMESVSREDAAKYRELKARGKSHDEIMAILKQIHEHLAADRQERVKTKADVKRMYVLRVWSTSTTATGIHAGY